MSDISTKEIGFNQILFQLNRIGKSIEDVTKIYFTGCGDVRVHIKDEEGGFLLSKELYNYSGGGAFRHIPLESDYDWIFRKDPY